MDTFFVTSFPSFTSEDTSIVDVKKLNAWSLKLLSNTSTVKVKSDHHSKFFNLAIGRKKPEKYQGLNGIRTHDLRDTGAMLDQLSCEATHGERGQFVEFISSCAVK